MIATRVLSPIVVQAVDGDRWIVVEPVRVVTARLGVVEVPAGFVTDFNSTPRIIWNLIPPTEFCEAGLVHDLLYQRGALAGVRVSRADADAVHRELVAWAGSADDPAARLTPPRRPAPAWKRAVFHRGLRACGWYVWARYRRAAAAGRADLRTAAPKG